MDDPGRLGVSQPKPFVYTPPSEIRLLSMRRERRILNNRRVILTLIIHWCSEAVLASWSERLAKSTYQENTLLALAVRLEPAFCRLRL